MKALTEKEIAWLNQIISERIHSDLYVENYKTSEFGQGMAILHSGTRLLFNQTDISVLRTLFEIDAQIDSASATFLILSLICSFLSRTEEYGVNDLDLHGRFTAKNITKNRDFLDRPVVDECIELIISASRRQWPWLSIREQNSRTIVSCDVDSPYELYTSDSMLFIKKLGGDILKRFSFRDFRNTLSNYYRTRRNDYSKDPNHTFDWMMDVNEKAGNKMAFYFLVDKLVPEFDAYYNIDEPRIRQLMRHIYDRGHEIGLHASYGTFKNPHQMKKEADKLRRVMDEEGIKQDEIGSRQHYLRWSTPETAKHLEAAGISYDTTLGYADHAGFRCGTCHEYPMFDIQEQKILNIRQRPLILMEASVLGKNYMNMGYTQEALDYMKTLKAVCQQHAGNFTLLWHNSSFRNEEDKIFYQELINA